VTFSAEHSSAGGSVVIAFWNAVKSDIAEMSDGDRKEFLAELGLEEPGLNCMIRAGHEMLSLQTYFTASGKKCTREPSLSMRPRLRRPVRSTPTSRKASFVQQGAKEAGKMCAEGKDYIV